MERASLSVHSKQRGAALLIAIIILGLAATAFSIEAFKTASLIAQRDTNSAISLADAKAALLGFSLMASGGGRPGNMPIPDYFASTEVPANYDGIADSGCMDATKSNGLPLIASSTNMRCLGRLPWQTLGMSISNPSQNDSQGVMPWYAVSANLVDPTCLSLLNPGILNFSYSGYVCSGATLPHPWLTVRDSSGNIISNRVAIILMLSGQPLSGQSRLSTPLGDVSNYLDTVIVPVGCAVPCVPGTYSNADFDNEYIMAAGISRSTAAINDKMLFITIDELMQLLEKRVAQEVKKAIDFPKIYGLTYRPWLLPFNNPTAWPASYTWGPSTSSIHGLIPYRCASSNTNCNSFNTEISWDISNPTVSIIPPAGTVDVASMNMYASQNITNPLDVSCELDGNGVSAVNCMRVITTGLPAGVVKRTVQLTITSNASNSFTYNDADSIYFHATRSVSRSGAVNPVLTVTDFDSGNNEVGKGTIRTTLTSTIQVRKIRLYPILPDWYHDNNWHEYMYGALAPAYQPSGDKVCNIPAECLTVTNNGNDRNDLQVVVMSAGRALDSTLLRPAPTYDTSNPAQTRGSNNLYDYFDSMNNSSEGTIFDRQWPLSSTFNDQVIW